MQAQRVAPPDLQCKDKFLIQCTVIPFGTTEQEITSEMVRSYKLLGVSWSKLFGEILILTSRFWQFSRGSGRNIEERKLKVLLISPPPSPVFVPINGESKQDPCYETSVKKDRVLTEVENIPPSHRVRAKAITLFVELNS